MMNPLHQLIERASVLPSAETYPACSKELIEEFAEFLRTEGLAWSEEISAFLQISNGFFYNGIYLFAIAGDTTPDYMDLAAENFQWDIPDRLPGCVLFGRSDEEVYVYNQPENKFQILDLTGWDEYYAFDSLIGLLEFVIAERS